MTMTFIELGLIIVALANGIASIFYAMYTTYFVESISILTVFICLLFFDDIFYYLQRALLRNSKSAPPSGGGATDTEYDKADRGEYD